jgi:Cu2+-exporting ATPase
MQKSDLRGKMVQNLWWATAYNLIAIPAAAGLFIRWKVEFPP